MSGASFLYLSGAAQLRLGLTAQAILPAVEAAYRAHATGIPGFKEEVRWSESDFLLGMGAVLPSVPAAGAKWVSYYPGNENLPTAMGLMVLNDPFTGAPLCVLEGITLTFARTAAAAAVAAKYLARPDAAAAAVIGAGALMRWVLPAVAQVLRRLRRVRVYARRPESRQRFCVELAGQTALELVPVSSAEEAVSGADVILSAVPHSSPAVIRADWWAPGATGIPLDGLTLWLDDAVAAADRLYTDDVQRMNGLLARRRLELRRPPVHVGAVSAGEAPGRLADAERLLAVFPGIAAIDVAVAHWLYQRAVAASAGVRLPLEQALHPPSPTGSSADREDSRA